MGLCGVYGGRRCLDLTLRLEPFKCWMYEYLDSKPTDTKVTESLDDCTYQTGFLDRIHFRSCWLPWLALQDGWISGNPGLAWLVNKLSIIYRIQFIWEPGHGTWTHWIAVLTALHWIHRLPAGCQDLLHGVLGSWSWIFILDPRSWDLSNPRTTGAGILDLSVLNYLQTDLLFWLFCGEILKIMFL